MRPTFRYLTAVQSRVLWKAVTKKRLSISEASGRPRALCAAGCRRLQEAGELGRAGEAGSAGPGEERELPCPCSHRCLRGPVLGSASQLVPCPGSDKGSHHRGFLSCSADPRPLPRAHRWTPVLWAPQLSAGTAAPLKRCPRKVRSMQQTPELPSPTGTSLWGSVQPRAGQSGAGALRRKGLLGSASSEGPASPQAAASSQLLRRGG